MSKRILSLPVIVCFFLTSLGPLPKVHADTVLGLPEPGTMVNLSPAYEPALIKGLTVHKDNPFLFDFIVDTGNSGIAGDELKKQGDRLVKYFFACLTIPEKDLWVNLSPYEKDKMIPQALGQTGLGRDLLAQDYILKQLTASLIYPEKGLGKEFWDRVYTKAREMYGTTQIPVNTFNKVWIVADKADVYEHGQTAFVVSGHLKVMLEEDYLAKKKHMAVRDGTSSIGANIVREIVLPEIEKEVNTGKNFAALHQIFNSLILANWYKKNLKEALLNQVYADKSTVKGVNLADPSVKEQIYQQYIKAYKKGVFNYIKEDAQPDGQSVPRKYFSGGFEADLAMTVSADPAEAAKVHLNDAYNMETAIGLNGSDAAMNANVAGQARSFLKLDPEENLQVSNDGRTYGGSVAHARWYGEDIGFDIGPLVDRITYLTKEKAAGLEIVDVSAGTGIASKTLLEGLRAKGIRIKKLSLVDIDTNLSRDYMNYAIQQLRDQYRDVVGEIDFYILQKLEDGSFAPVSAIQDLRGSADYVLMENAIHVVPSQYRRTTLEGIAQIMKPGAKLVMGSGSITTGPQENGTVFIDSLFSMVRNKVLEIIKVDPKYAELEEVVGRANQDNTANILQKVFPEKPSRDEVLNIGNSIGLPMHADTHFTKLGMEDFRTFVTGIEGYINSAILPELGAYLRTLPKDGQEIKNLRILRNEAIKDAYDEVFSEQGEKGFQVSWVRFVATKVRSSDAAMSAPVDIKDLEKAYVLWDEQTSLLDANTGKSLVGGKSYQAARYWRDDPENNLRSFSGTARASVDFLHSDPKLLPEIYRISQSMDASDEVAREEAGKRIRELISNAAVPQAIETALREGYRRLVGITEQPLVAVRSSGKAEDISMNIPELAGINLGANAGQHDTYLGEMGEDAVVKRWKDCIASLYTARVLGYRDSMMVFSAFGKILPNKQLTADIIAKLKQGNDEDKLVARAIEDKNIMIISSFKLLHALQRSGFNEAVHYVEEARQDFIKVENIAMGVTIMPMAGVDIAFVAFGHEMTSSWTGKDFQNIPQEEYLNKGRVVTITTNYGLGESIVQGTAMPDTFLVHIFNDESGEHINILNRTLGTKSVQTVYVAPIMEALRLDDQSLKVYLSLLNAEDIHTFAGTLTDEDLSDLHLRKGANLFVVRDVLDRLIKEKVDATLSVEVTNEELAQFQYTREELNELAHLLKAFLKDPKIKTMFTDVPQELRNQFSATDQQIRNIAREYMKKASGYNHLVDMEGAVGKNFSRMNTAVTVQRRPSNVDGDVKEPNMIRINYTYVKAADVEAIRSKKQRITEGGLLTDIVAGDQLVQGIPTRNSFSGQIYKIDESKELTPQFEEIKRLADEGHKIIIRTDETTPDYIDVLKYKNVMGVIANSGGATSHAAVVSRELGIATVVGIQSWLDKLADTLGAQKANEIEEYLDRTGSIVTVDANAGEETGLGTVYAGELPVSTRDLVIDVSRLPYIYTKIAYIMGMPHPMLAMSKMSQYEGYYGVALMRGEFAYAEENINPRAGRAYDLMVVNHYLRTFRQNKAAKEYYASLSLSEKQAVDSFRSLYDRRAELRRQGQDIPLDVTEQYIQQYKSKRPSAFLESLSTHQQTDIELLIRAHSEELGKLTKQIVGYLSYNEFFDAVHGGAVGTMAAANSQTDNTVVYRSIDFKKNEAAELIGSKIFDPFPEAATMVGERGARWLLKPENKVILVEEIRMLLRQVKRGYKNIGFMFPFVSTPQELDQLLTILEEEERNFSQQENKPVYLREVGQMVELPSNIIQADEFIKVLKGHEEGTKEWFKANFNVDIKRKSFLSFGTNDLTQLTLGADRDNPKMRQLFNEAHPFVIESIRHVVNMANKYGIKCGLCGQALVNLVNVDPDKAEEILMLLGSTGGYAGTDYLGTIAAIIRSASATLKHGKVLDEIAAGAEPVSLHFESTLERGAATRPLYQVTTQEDLAKTYMGDFIFVHDGLLLNYDKDDKLKEQLSRLGAIIYSNDALADAVKAISKKLRVPAIKVTQGVNALGAVPNGEKVTIDFNRRSIFRGDLKVVIDIPEVASKINVNVKSHPELSKIEFNETLRASDLYKDLKVYPAAFLAYDDGQKRNSLDQGTVEQIERIMASTGSTSAVEALRHEIERKIKSKMVGPNARMVYETLDLQSDDFMKLLGHHALGVQEEVNPPLGFNGLESLMDDPQLKEVFKIEMGVIKELTDQGFNISIQFNSIKTPKSLQQAMGLLKETGIDATKVKVGMNTAWPGNYLFLQDYLEQGLSFVTLDQRKLAQGYLAADLYKNPRVRDTYQWSVIKEDMSHPIKIIEAAIADFSARKSNVAIRTIPFDSAMTAKFEVTPGGIDLNTANLGMTVTKDADGGVKVNFDQAMIGRIKAQGVFSADPVIIRITPMSSAQISPLLGVPSPA